MSCNRHRIRDTSFSQIVGNPSLAEQNNIDAGSNLLSDPTNRRRDRADSLTDKRHVFNITGVLMPEWKLSNKTANYLANHNRLSFGIVMSSGDLFTWAATAC
jgi:hypothetical protein